MNIIEIIWHLISQWVQLRFLIFYFSPIIVFNGSQLAKMKKYIPHKVTAMKFIEKKRLV